MPNPDAWKEYTDKANNFTDWFTAVLISNFAYLVGLLNEGSGFELLGKAYLWNQSFMASCVALGAIFIAKVLGVLAASMRVHANKHEKNVEKARIAFFFIFGLWGIISLFYTAAILKNLYTINL